MAEEIHISESLSKKEKYESLIPQIRGLIEGETELIACLSNIMAALKYGMGFFWVGCYLVKGNELVLGPFQGPVACTRIAFGQGVCGAAWQNKKTVIVEDVDEFPGHIACSADSKSEIVVPVFDQCNEVALILDVDSTQLSAFDNTDQEHLETIAELIAEKLPS